MPRDTDFQQQGSMLIRALTLQSHAPICMLAHNNAALYQADLHIDPFAVLDRTARDESLPAVLCVTWPMSSTAAGT